MLAGEIIYPRNVFETKFGFRMFSFIGFKFVYVSLRLSFNVRGRNYFTWVSADFDGPLAVKHFKHGSYELNCYENPPFVFH